jgi:hypothetical protein
VMRFALPVAGIALLVSCTGGQGSGAPAQSSSSTTVPSATPSVQRVTDYSSFTDGLEAAGYVVRPGERTERDHLFRAGRTVFIDGVQVSMYEYQTEKALREWRASVSKDGYSIPAQGGGMVDIEWSPPRFYSAGRLLVLYFGSKQRTIDALDNLLGPPFAGV